MRSTASRIFAGIRHRRGLQHDVLVLLGDRDRLVDVEVAAHVPEDDGRLGARRRGRAIGVRRRHRLVAAVEERRRAVLGGDADQPQRLLARGMGDRRDRMELQPLEAELECPLEQRHRLVAVPRDGCARRRRAGPGRRAHASAISSSASGLTSGASTIVITTPRSIPGLVHPPDALRRLEVPAERGDLVDVQVGVDDHVCGATASSSGWPGATSCQTAGFVNVRSTPPPSQLVIRSGRIRTARAAGRGSPRSSRCRRGPR